MSKLIKKCLNNFHQLSSIEQTAMLGASKESRYHRVDAKESMLRSLYYRIVQAGEMWTEPLANGKKQDESGRSGNNCYAMCCGCVHNVCSLYTAASQSHSNAIVQFEQQFLIRNPLRILLEKIIRNLVIERSLLKQFSLFQLNTQGWNDRQHLTASLTEAASSTLVDALIAQHEQCSLS